MKRKLFLIFWISLLLYAAHAGAVDLVYDTIKEETNIYINVPGNGALAQGGEIWQNTMVIDVRVVNNDQEKMPYRGDFQWDNVPTLISGQELKLSSWIPAPNTTTNYRWELEELPENSGDSVYEVGCTVDGQRLTKRVTIHCKTIELPTGLKLENLDDTVYSYVGAKVKFSPVISPEGWQVPGYPQVRWGFDDEADEFADCLPVKGDNDKLNERNELTFTKAGTFYSTYIITSDTISIGRTLTFIISDGKKILLPEGLTRIEDEAFEGTHCETVIVPKSCTYIGHYAFRNCTSLTHIQVPASTEIEPDAFEGCGTVEIERIN